MRADQFTQHPLHPVALGNEIRREQALELRLQGKNYAEIGAALVPPVSRQAAYKLVKHAASDRREENEKRYDTLIEMERARLDRLWEIAFKKVLEEGRDCLVAMDRCLAIMKRRADLEGLDEARKIDITHRVRTLAQSLGLDPDAAVKEAEDIIREAQLQLSEEAL
jgi:hypothetical protein